MWDMKALILQYFKLIHYFWGFYLSVFALDLPLEEIFKILLTDTTFLKEKIEAAEVEILRLLIPSMSPAPKMFLHFP